MANTKQRTQSKRITRFVLKLEEAEAIAEALLTDLKGRSTLNEAWWELLPQTQEEVKGRWAKIIRQRCNRFARTPQWQDKVSPEVREDLRKKLNT